jgi:hypothetical protein
MAAAVGPNGLTQHNGHSTSRKTRRPPIRRSHPGPITRAGVVSLWARGLRAWRTPTPGFVGGPGVPTISLPGETPPRHRHAKRPPDWVEEGPLHPCHRD